MDGTGQEKARNPCRSAGLEDIFGWCGIMRWRRSRDSNPGWSYPHNGFRDRPVQPLRHFSAAAYPYRFLERSSMLPWKYCRSRKKPRERRLLLHNRLFLRSVTLRVLTFYDAIKIQARISSSSSAVRWRRSGSSPRVSTLSRNTGSVFDWRRLKRNSGNSTDRPSVRSITPPA